MATSHSPSDQLARLYREARILVLGGGTAHIDRAAALHREFLALRASLENPASEPLSGWEATLLERTRRAVIVALRHQAVALTEEAADPQGSPAAGEDSTARVLEYALELSTTALRLHEAHDLDVEATARAGGISRRMLEQATSQASEPPAALTVTSAEPRAASSAPAVPSTAPTPASAGSEQPPAAAEPPQPAAVSASWAAAATVVRPGTNEISPRVPWVVAAAPQARTSSSRAARGLVLWITGALVVVIGGAIAFSGRKLVTADNAGPEKLHTSVPASSVPAPVPSPPATGVVTLILRSNPPGATVTIDGQFRGTTPVRLEGRVGEALTVTLRRGDRVWRGVLRINNESEQAMTIRLAASRSARVSPPRPTPTPPGRPAGFEVAMREGTRLYEAGWFGPAAGRFRRALAINPSSAPAYLWLGRALTKAGRQGEARRALEQAIALAETGPVADEARILLSQL